MKHLIILTLFVFFAGSGYSQDFFNGKFNKRKNYIILANPTVGNLKTIGYLQSHGLLDINLKKTKFVGVYLEGQEYDFSESEKYIESAGAKNIFLHKVKGNLTEDNLFETNECTPEIRKIFDNSIGIIFFGGPDIPPSVYGEENSLSVVTDSARHFFETTFLFHLLGGSQNPGFTALLEGKPGYMATGFCLGMQTMNVATGGTLIQDIPAEVYNAGDATQALAIGRSNLHRNYWQELDSDTLLMGINLHKIRFTNHPFFGKAVKISKNSEPRVCSSHHQAVEKLGKGLVVTALSDDGKIIEGLAHEKYPNVFAVQFHPEVPALYEDLSKRKFHPDDIPNTYHQIIGTQSVKFHKKYWKHISEVLNSLK